MKKMRMKILRLRPGYIAYRIKSDDPYFYRSNRLQFWVSHTMTNLGIIRNFNLPSLENS